MIWLARGLLIIPAVALVAVSFAVNGYFWFATMTHDPVAQAAWIAISVICGLIKVGIPIAFVAMSVDWRDQKPVAVLFVVALVFDIFSGLGFSALTRGDAVASRQHDAAPVAELVRQRDVAAAELDKLDAVPLTARVKVERDAAAVAAPNCKLRGNAVTEACRQLAALDATLTEAEERDRLAAKVADLSARLTVSAPARDVDPQTSSIALALSAVGLSPDRETISKAIGLLLVLLIELGSTALPRAAFIRAPAAPVPADPIRPAEPVHVEPPAAKPRRARAKSRIDLLDVIRSAAAGRMAIPGATVAPDGWLYVSQRALADVCGRSPPSVGRDLSDAEKAGHILRRTDSRGAAILLLSASNPARAAGV